MAKGKSSAKSSPKKGNGKHMMPGGHMMSDKEMAKMKSKHK